MEQKVKIKEKLIVHILDEDGNVVDTKEFKPPSTPLEKIASKLGILKRHNTVHTSGLNVAAKRWVGITQDPVIWVCARMSNENDYPGFVGTWHFRSADVSVNGDKAYLKNAIDHWNAGPSAVYDTMGTAYTYGDTGTIVSFIDGVDVMNKDVGGGSIWVEIEFDFDTS